MSLARAKRLWRWTHLCLLFLLLLSVSSSSLLAQVYICDQQFFGAPTLAAGFSAPGLPFTNSISGTGNFGRNAPSLRLDATGQILQYGPWSQDADHVSFFHKCASSAASTIAVLESPDGTNWTPVGSATSLSTSATFDANLIASSRYLRLVFTLASPGANVYLDDLRIRALTTACVNPPEILEVLIDGGCTSSSCEDGNEFVYFDTGGQPLDTRFFELMNPSVIAGGCAYGGNGTGDNANTNWVLASAYTAAQTTYIQDLNAIAGCGTVFVPVPSDNIIPANSRVLAITGSAPDALYNLSAYCPDAPVYVMFSTRNNCPTTAGKYSNSACSLNCARYITIFNHQTGCLDNELYSQSATATPNGQVFVFSGGTYGYSTIYSCLLMMLPLELTSLSAISDVSGVRLSWVMEASEQPKAFIIERSTDAMVFQAIGEIAVSSGEQTQFSYLDTEVTNGRFYYRIRWVSEDGTEHLEDLVASVMVTGRSAFEAYVRQEKLFIQSSGDISNLQLMLFTPDGKIVLNEKVNLSMANGTVIDLPANAEGVLGLLLLNDDLRWTKRIYVAD